MIKAVHLARGPVYSSKVSHLREKHKHYRKEERHTKVGIHLYILRCALHILKKAHKGSNTRTNTHTLRLENK